MSPGCLAGGCESKGIAPVNWGLPRLFLGPIKRFLCFSMAAKRGRLEYLKRSLSIAHIMASGDTCPQGTSNAHHVATLAGLLTSPENPTPSAGA
jgi:hypothetical protein